MRVHCVIKNILDKEYDTNLHLLDLVFADKTKAEEYCEEQRTLRYKCNNCPLYTRPISTLRMEDITDYCDEYCIESLEKGCHFYRPEKDVVTFEVIPREVLD